MSVMFPEDDWFPEDEDLEAEMFSDMEDFLDMDEDDINAAVQMFSDILGATPDGVDPYAEG